MFRVLKVHRSGFYAWLHEPLSPRAKTNAVLTAKAKEFYDQSMGIYGKHPEEASMMWFTRNVLPDLRQKQFM
jgi:hypothetical protein